MGEGDAAVVAAKRNGNGSMRDSMPTCSAFIDDVREAFGRDAIDGVIRRGLRADCAPSQRFFAAEGSHAVGQRAPVGAGVTAASMVIIPPKKSPAGGR